MRAAASGVSLGRDSAGLSLASDCWASTDLLSHPLAIFLIIVPAGKTGLGLGNAQSIGTESVFKFTKIEQRSKLMSAS